MKNIEKTKLSLILIYIISSLLGCATYEAREVPIKTSSEYQNVLTISEVTIAVDSFDEPVKAESAFYVDTTKKNIRPLLIIIENKSSENYLIARSKILLNISDDLSIEPVGTNYVFEMFDASEFLWGSLFGLLGSLSAHEANEMMKADWNEKVLPEKLIIEQNSTEYGFVFYETEEPLKGKALSITATNLNNKEVLEFVLEIE